MSFRDQQDNKDGGMLHDTPHFRDNGRILLERFWRYNPERLGLDFDSAFSQVGCWSDCHSHGRYMLLVLDIEIVG